MIIENQYLKIDFKTQGSEWISFFDKQRKLEYAWQGEEKYWTGRNPTLFPIVGKLWRDKFFHQGKEYSLSNHGFARHSNFILKKITDQQISLSLNSNKTTKINYPFDFQLNNHYLLNGKTLQITKEVKNTGSTDLPFSIGAHPAFNCPWRKSENFEDYKIVFEKEEQLTRLFLNPDGSFDKKRINFGLAKRIRLKKELFNQDAIVFESLRSNWVRLENKSEGLTMHLNQCPWFGIWTKLDAPFICLEPWQGHGDFTHNQDDFSTREGTMIIPPKTSYEFYYQLTID